MISKQGGNDYDNLAGWRRRLKSREEMIVIKEDGKVDRIKSSGGTNGVLSLDVFWGQPIKQNQVASTSELHENQRRNQL